MSNALDVMPTVLRALVNKVRHLDDCGPSGESWQSSELQHLIYTADDVLSAYEEEVEALANSLRRRRVLEGKS